MTYASKPKTIEGQTAKAVDPATPLFAVGDLVKTSPDSEHLYEVAELKMYPHGPMVGIYDESSHVDFWNPSSLTLHEKAPHGHKRTCTYLDDARADCDCMTFAERGRYLAWLGSANDVKRLASADENLNHTEK